MTYPLLLYIERRSNKRYNLEDSKLLSDVTTLYQKVGDNMTQETASQSLVSTLQGFNMQASEAESIIDKFHEVNFTASVYSNVYALCA